MSLLTRLISAAAGAALGLAAGSLLKKPKQKTVYEADFRELDDEGRPVQDKK